MTNITPCFSHSALNFGEPDRAGRPAWVFLHGFLGTGEDWAAVLQAWARAGPCPARVWAPDLPGHGREPLGGAPSYASWTAWLDARLPARGPVVLVGYSLGGRVALAWAARHPERVAALVLLAAHPGLVEPAARARRAAQDAARAARLRQQGLRRFLEAWYALPLFGLGRRPGLRAALVARRAQQNPEAMAAVVAGMSPGRQPALWTALARLAPRVVYVAGARDGKYVALARRLTDLRPALMRIAIVEHAAHMLHLDAPHTVARLLREVHLDTGASMG